MSREISPERKQLYYAGMGVTGLGVFLIVVGFIGFAVSGSQFKTQFVIGFFITFFLGMVTSVLGQFMMRVAARGAAGSGVILDPQQAREDLEPWARMAGGVVHDALDESGVSLGKSAEKLSFDEELRRLHRLMEEGLLDEKEYEARKKQILDRLGGA